MKNKSIWVYKTFKLPREQARQAVKDYIREFPKPAYWTKIDHWKELADDHIEVTLRRLPSAD